MPHVRSYAGNRDCGNCGTPFRLRADAAKKSDRGKFCSVKCSNEGRFGPLTVDIASAKRMYCEQNMTLKEIAAAAGISWKRVRTLLASAGTEFRSGRRRVAGKRSMVRYRKIAAQTAGRPLAKGEIVHHLNTDETDDRPENLVVVLRPTHAALHKQLETISARLYTAGLITFDRHRGYEITPQLREMMG